MFQLDFVPERFPNKTLAVCQKVISRQHNCYNLGFGGGLPEI